MLLSTVALALFMTCASSQSVLLCLDNGGIDITSPASKNSCIGYPRGRDLYEKEGDKALIHLMTPDASCGIQYGSPYSLNYPSTYLLPGSSFYPEWAARNQAGPQAGNVKFYLSPVDVTSDPSPSLFENHLFCEIPFSNCNLKLGSYDAPCTGKCSIPSYVVPGKYIVQWRWDAGHGEVYSACSDIEILSEKEARGYNSATTRTSSTTKTSSTSTSTTKSSSSSSSTTKASSTTQTSTGGQSTSNGQPTNGQATSQVSGNGQPDGSSTTNNLDDNINSPSSLEDDDDWWTLAGILAVVFGGLFLITLAALIALYVTKVRKPAEEPASSSSSSYPNPPSVQMSSPPTEP